MHPFFNFGRIAAAAMLTLTLVLAQACSVDPSRSASGDAPSHSYGGYGTFSATAGGY